jgi:hypothetical protein
VVKVGDVIRTVDDRRTWRRPGIIAAAFQRAAFGKNSCSPASL